MSSNKISPDQFGNSINEILKDFYNVTEEEIKEAVDQISEEAVNELHQTSPKRTGKYGRSWRSKVNKRNKKQYEKIVYNDKRYRLTHLLEKGHKLVNGKTSKEYPHIGKAADKAANDLLNKIVKKVGN